MTETNPEPTSAEIAAQKIVNARATGLRDMQIRKRHPEWNLGWDLIDDASDAQNLS